MLSVLIPCYNYVPIALVQTLSAELENLKLAEAEILVWDDASDVEFQKQIRQLAKMPFVAVAVLEENLGRAKIRNRLSEAAKNEFLLFLDADVLPENPNFISNYIKKAKEAAVIVGGRSYAKKAPEFQEFLHWKYGSARESSPAEVRNAKPYFGFQSNNFLIKKSIIQKFPFPDNFHAYGHEDSVFGKNLEINQVSILHINNSAVHLGLQERAVFLSKSLEAVTQLVGFIASEKLDVNDIKISAFHKKLQDLKLLQVFSFFATRNAKRWYKHLLHAQNPSLYVFDCWRLHHFMNMLASQ